jgi:uncharacterized protein (TIGR02996 family)
MPVPGTVVVDHGYRARVATPTNPELEARILTNPDDLEVYLVYSDWLSERGDPRGELIAVQRQLGQQPDDATLKAREQALLDANGATWLGELVKLGPKDLAVTWRWGFIDAVRIGPPIDQHEYSEIDFPDTIAQLMRLPGIGFLRVLVIGARGFDDSPTSWSGCIEALVDAGVPPSLRSLAFSRGEFWDISSTELGDLSPLYPQLQHLRELSIELGAMSFGAMDLPSLQKLEIITGGLTGENVASIVEARWPALETLSLCIGQTGNDYGCTVELSDLEPLLTTDHLPGLRHLSLSNSSLADELAAALPRSPLLPRLQTLGLDRGTLSDAGARTLIAHWDAFAHLQSLDLSHGFFSNEIIDQLKKLKGPAIVLDDLQRSDDDDRYCAISE